MTNAQLQHLRKEVRYAYPLRPWQNAKVDAGFLDPAYKSAFGKWHRGIDLNGTGGGDTDLGLPVQSMFPGRVVEVTETNGYGKTVLVRSEPWVAEHVLSTLDVEGDVIDVLYTHLQQITVTEGEPLDAGDHVGSIGKGGRDQYVAHLHLEIRRTAQPAIVAQGESEEHKRHVEATLLDPERVLAALPFGDYSNVLSSRRQLAPARLLFVNDEELGEETVVVLNQVGDKVYLRDALNPKEPTPEPHPFEAFLAALRSLFQPQ